MSSVICHYSVLGVDRDADDEQLRKAYRKLALQWHPDKNQHQPEAATAVFQQVQAAYAVLSDPHERSWYDAHREAILRGKPGAAGDDADDPVGHLWAFFSSSAYDGFGDGEGGFFAVYDGLFHSIDLEEEQSREERGHAPRFGTSLTEWNEVKSFYGWWEGFGTSRSCATADKYDTRQAPNRQVRRAMEKENAKRRSEAKRKINECVRNLVAYVKKRDSRVAAHRAQQERENKAKLAKAKAMRAAREAQMEAARPQPLEQEEDEELCAELDALAEEYASNEERRSRRARRDGEAASDGEEAAEADGEWEEEAIFCVACDKLFKTRLQLINHEKSKKHAEAVRQLRLQLEAEDAEFAAEISAAEAEVRAEADEAAAASAAAKYVRAHGEALDEEEESAGEEEEGAVEGGGKGGKWAEARARKAAKKAKAARAVRAVEAGGVGGGGKWSNKRAAGKQGGASGGAEVAGARRVGALADGEGEEGEGTQSEASSGEEEGEDALLRLARAQERPAKARGAGQQAEGKSAEAARKAERRRQAAFTAEFAKMRFGEGVESRGEEEEEEEEESGGGGESSRAACAADGAMVEEEEDDEPEEEAEDEELAQRLASEQLRGKSAGRDFMIGLLGDDDPDPLLFQPKLEATAYSFSEQALSGADKVNKNKASVSLPIPRALVYRFNAQALPVGRRKRKLGQRRRREKRWIRPLRLTR
ncbi:hypothetical protein AB1Y20_019506 [Prymnesium parvum]|uniref:J domain-containing protein n=1 Tax=Prymnesium parvum TaxID=97485 RepID=A0AB34JUB8_PRYPA